MTVISSSGIGPGPLGIADTRPSAEAPAEIARLVERFPWVTATSIEGADHFFFGKLFPLGQAVEGWARRLPRERAAR